MSDDEGHAGWGPTLSFELTNEDGNVEEQTGTLAEVRTGVIWAASLKIKVRD